LNRFLFFITFLIVPTISSVSKYPFLRKKDEAQLRIRKSRKWGRRIGLWELSGVAEVVEEEVFRSIITWT